MAPDVAYERAFAAEGYARVAGIDEAGRGCWAGPVVAAAVLLTPRIIAAPELLAGIDDSKQLTPAQRAAGYERILACAEGVGVGIVAAHLIDAFGILPATRLAMTVAMLALPRLPDALLIDAVPLEQLTLPQRAIIRGDACSLSIAAASVVAKVTRDSLMRTADMAFPGYGFAMHKGYGTAAHRDALMASGPCLLHRATFRPVAECASTPSEQP